jgi:hypothetical protein
MRVRCAIRTVYLAGHFTTIPSTAAVCSRCGHATESFGTSDRSLLRCLAVMREECPLDERNFYTVDGADEYGG